MRILIISQTFWPDTASVAQHMTDLAVELVKRGHFVDVYSSRHAYEDSNIKFKAHEEHVGIRINRIRTTGFGKRRIIGRLSDFFTFNILLYLRLQKVKKGQYDVVICTTSPPLVAYLAMRALRRKKISFCYWAMDLQPELSIASGLIRKSSLSARVLTYMGNYVIHHSDFIIALDTYMKDHLVRRGAKPDNVYTVPVWPVMEKIYEGKREENVFRIQNGFGDKIVIMYSGNHSYVHPLDTLLEATLALRDRKEFLFVFIGGGVRKKDVTDFKEKHELDNIVQLPYQPRNNIHYSLGTADIHVVIMGDGQVGFTHPNKIYGAMFIGRPILYIGPSPCHATDILDVLNGNIQVMHGEGDKLTAQLLDFGSLSESKRACIGQENRNYAQKYFSPDVLKTEMVELLERRV